MQCISCKRKQLINTYAYINNSVHKTKQENNTKKKHREKLQQQHDRIMTRIIYILLIIVKDKVNQALANTLHF